ncbi:MAG: hypothetical protein Q8K64_02740 [Sediminibacterium sp.]|nr:hypothetical protein [Sediminibacterium sp.]
MIIISSSNLLYSCSDSKPKEEYDFKVKNTQISFPNFKLITDTIPLNINYSGEGIFEILDDTLVIVDEMYKIIYFFSISKGKLLNSYEFFDKIKNPTSFNQSIFFAKLNSGFVLMNGRKLSFFDEHMYMDTTIRLKFSKKNLLDPFDNPDPLSMDIYEINYRKRKKARLNNLFFISVDSEHPKFNPYTNKEYYATGEAFGIVDLETQKVLTSNIKKSIEYNDTCCLPTTDWASIAVNEKEREILVQFPVDSFIYVYNFNLTKKYKYGLSNKHNLKRVISTSLDVAFDSELFSKAESQTAVFESVFYLSAENLVARNYIDYSSNKQFLQIFRDNSLIFDQEVPIIYEFIGQNKSSLFVRIKNTTILCKLNMRF